LFYKVEKGKLSERVGGKVMGLRYFNTMIARLPAFFILGIFALLCGDDVGGNLLIYSIEAL